MILQTPASKCSSCIRQDWDLTSELTLYIHSVYICGMKRVDDVDAIIVEPIGFEWDEWNIEKNRALHHVMPEEQEQVFFDENKVIYEDKGHSLSEERRLIIIGKTKTGRLLYEAFTLRNGKIRIISARDLNKKEVNLFK